MKNIIVGINLPVLPDGTVTYDGNVSIIADGKLISALAEERISRKKYDGDYKQAFDYLLDRFNLKLSDLEAVSVCSFGQPMLGSNEPSGKLKEKLKHLYDSGVPVHNVDSHHEAHAIAAASQCPFDKAIIAVLDHTGNIIGDITDEIFLEKNSAEQTSYFLLENGSMKLIARDHSNGEDEGYGRLYGDVTCYLGFDSYRESGKTMGLASFGDDSVLENYLPFKEEIDGKVLSNLSDEKYCDDNTKDIMHWFASNGLIIPKRRKKEEVFRPFDMHLAAWVQSKIQQSVAKKVSFLMQKYSVKNLCVTGGVAMNSVLNRYLEEVLKANVFIPSSPGDAGLALGAAAEYLWKKHGKIPKLDSSPYLGPIYKDDEIELAIKHNCDGFIVKKLDDPAKEAANALYQGKIIGWFQDGSEYGPRALGNRSILASPVNSWTKEILNNQVKLREWFRPYAPSVLEEEAHKYFDIMSLVPYMMKTATVKQSAKQDILACIHVDNTARLQTVSQSMNPKYYKLIKSFSELSGIPVVLNTSFNLAGMPIVETPLDAIQCFKKSIGIDMLFLGDFVIYSAHH